ncbi:GldG family protein [Ruminococcus sp.]|uniref:GldG family protein n=1 Tax=Ruminococcus sp. TaxID=41978 RepID=UPI002E764A1E|nr:GldG family protein [Ruminococcus sp.]MEE1396697.1 GldG family protein [Ruminococcus sp.]
MQKQDKKSEKTAAPISEEKRQKKMQVRKKLKYGGIATAVTVIFVAVVVLLNVVVAQVCKRNPDAVLDLTTANLYEISDDTVDYIKNLDQDVEIAISSEESTFQSDKYYKMISETISKYQGYSDHISVTYFDTTKDPDILSKYQDLYAGDISSNQIIVTSGDRIKVYSLTDMFEIDQDKYQSYYYGYASLSDCITGFKGEQTLTTAIMNVTDSNPKSVAVITKSNGNYIFSATQANAYAVTAMENLLNDNGYDVKELDMVNDALDAETYDIVVLPAPANDLTMDAIKKLQDFLQNGGNLGKQLIYVADYTQSVTPNLDAFLKDWNLQVDSSYVREDDNNRNQTVQIVASAGKGLIAPIVSLGDSENYGGNLANSSLPIVAPLARPIQKLPSNNGRVVYSLLQSSDTSYAYPLTQQASSGEDTTESASEESQEATEATTTEGAATTSFDTDSAVRGANTVMALSQSQQSTGSELIESDVIVLGSMAMMDYYLTQDSSYNNAEYFVGVLNSVCGKEDSIVIASKDMTATSISATQTQLVTLRTIVVFLIPLAVAAAGIVVFLRRRNR